MAVAMDKPRPPQRVNADVPRELSDLVMQLLEKDPSARLASAGEVVAGLQALEQQPQQKQSKTGNTAFAFATGPQSSQRREPEKRVPPRQADGRHC